MKLKEFRIKADPSIKDEAVLEMVNEVIEQGKISQYKGKSCYCFVTYMFYEDEPYEVIYKEYRKTIFFQVNKGKKDLDK